MTLDLQALQVSFAAAVLGLPEPVIRSALRWIPARTKRTGVDPRTELLLRAMELSGRPPSNELPLAEARREFIVTAGAMGGTQRPLASVMSRSIPGPGGTIPVRVYLPTLPAGRELPAIVYYHGGGWVIGNLDTHDRLCRVLAAETGCVVIAVDYRLSPEHRFPAASDDALAAFRWVTERGPELHADPSRVAVAGDSAGGNLAAVTALRALADGGPTPCFQLLIYPVTDLRCESASYDACADGYLLTRDMMLWFRSHYLGDPALDEEAARRSQHPHASPLLAEDLTGLPQALVLTAEFDPLREEGRAYAERLREAGVAVSYRCHAGLVHGFATLGGSIPAARQAISEACTAVRLAVARP